MKWIDNKNKRLSTIKYLFKFTVFLLKEKITKFKKLQEQFIEYRDFHINEKKEKKENYTIKHPKIELKPKTKKIMSPLLVLFDAENMPLQEHYRLIQKIIIEKFGKKSWESAKLETAYQESTEFYNNKGYNQDIKTHYVKRGEDKADDKLVEIATKYKASAVIIVTNDKGLIERLQSVTSKTSGKLFVYNQAFLQEYRLIKHKVELSQLKSLKEKRDLMKKELELIDKNIVRMEKNTTDILSLFNIKNKKPEKPISENLKNANLDKNIKSDILTNPLFINFTEQLIQIDAPTKSEALAQSEKVLKTFIKLPQIKHLLETKGLNINIFKIALRYAIYDFEQSTYGYSSFINFIQYVIKNSEIKLVFKAPCEYKLFLKDTPINELEMSEVIEKNNYNLKNDVLSEDFGNSFADLDFFKNKYPSKNISV